MRPKRTNRLRRKGINRSRTVPHRPKTGYLARSSTRVRALRWGAIVLAIFMAFFVLWSGYIRGAIPFRLGQAAPAERLDRPVIALAPRTLNLGNVRPPTVVSRDFRVSNQGNQDLVIQALSSSCDCTTAQMINGGIESPIFGMEGHTGSKNPQGWSTTIMPGEEAILRVFYDPTVHPGVRGALTRIITITSNDPINPRMPARIELNQL